MKSVFLVRQTCFKTTVGGLPHTNHELPCSQQVRERWLQLDQHQAVSSSSEPSDQLTLWQQQIQQHAQLHLLNTQDWQDQQG